MKKIFLFILMISFFYKSSNAQQSDSLKKDSLRITRLEEVVITATRSKKNLQQVSSPITIITADEIKKKSLVRLDEILAEKAGMIIQYDPHGSGIQIQGLDPAYTLILVDGLPMIGRSTGIFDLSRISTDNIDRIEIVKGPTSSLYGSEAMAGVINIITKEPENGFTGNVTGRYGTNNSSNLSINSGYKNGAFKIIGFVNRFSSSGYSLNSTADPTVSPFSNYTFNTKAGYQFNKKTELSLSVRYFDGNQRNEALVNQRFTLGNGNEKDFNIAPILTHRFNRKLTSALQLFRSTYKTSSNLFYQDNQSLYDQSFFDQSLNRVELQNDYKIKPNVRLNFGIGGQYESVIATRYTNKKTFNSGYGYFQTDWLPVKKLNIIIGGRFDTHSVYKSQFSPKLSASYAISNKLTVLGSAGKGYKAPDFRQLYLNFTNATVGYSVFGFEEANAGLKQLDQEGQLQTKLIDASSLQSLNAESSYAYNFGFRFNISEKINLTSNVFRNNIDNLIETSAVAVKTNGQSVYSYFNLNKVYTQGIEAGLKWEPIARLKLSGEIQYLEAFDEDVLDRIGNGQLFGRDPNTNVTTNVNRSSYGGLLNRSKYTYNIGLNHEWKKYGINSSIRSIYRGRYGYKDIDGNGIVNLNEEYTKGFTLVNASLSKSLIKDSLNLQFSVQNLFNYTSSNVILNLPGRLFYTSITYNLN